MKKYDIKLKLWERIVLFFIPGKWEYIDIMGRDMELLCKTFRGKCYVLGERPEGGP